ncbi:Abhydrolase-4 domain-containing protein [Mycena kentingensis (nom. inval.)]|nr:Abhydrolase-4 domain-containing protein [Mycena kentingensis (nom. inval.)]
MAFKALLVLVSIALGVNGAPSCSPDFSWEKLAPSKDLVWTECYDGKECARLEVPLDYENPDKTTATIPIVRLRHTSETYRGPILVNPGGPGLSGVDMVLQMGDLLAQVVGPEFDLVGFDPRGTARSTPRPAPFFTRTEYELFDPEHGFASVNASEDGLARLWARSTLFGELAAERDDGSLRFFTTDYTARDMLRIVQAYGEEKLQYWAVSYGSLLGQVFSTMFPDKVGRVIIDGIVDADDYFATKWVNNLLDSDKALQAFADGCVSAGPNDCAFYSPSASTIISNIDALYASLHARPLPVLLPGSNTGGVFTFSNLRYTVFHALYSPYALVAPLAQGLAELQKNGDATTLFSLFIQMQNSVNPTPFEPCGCGDSAAEQQFVSFPEYSIICNDGERVSPKYEDLVDFYAGLRQLSSFADVWNEFHARCMAWPDFPKTNFRGPIVANTSFPLLIIGNTIDPVTSLWAAKKTSKGLNGSVVLTQDSIGHTSISGASVCTAKYVREYFFNGSLPPVDTVCPVVTPLFPGSAEVEKLDTGSKEDSELLKAVVELATQFIGIGRRRLNI